MKRKSRIEIGFCTVFATGLALSSSSCTVKTSAHRDTDHVMEVSVPQQKMALYRKGKLIRKYPVSTSKFGLGNEKGSYRTPTGKMEVAEKIGEGKPAGAVFKSRRWTGEVVRPNARGRDPIVSRILWLKGLEKRNKNTYSRCIYIHGTAAEKDIGRPASYGCVRMKSRDVIDLYRNVGQGAKVFVVNKNLWIDLKNKLQPAKKLQAVPVSDATDVLSPIFKPNEGIYLWNELESPATGEDILVADGYELAYLTLPEEFEFEVD